jgi:hypothetical protein
MEKENKQSLPFKAIDPGELKSRLSLYAPTIMTIDPASVPKEEIPVIKKLIKAADVMDRIFWKQVSTDGASFREILKKTPSENSSDLLKYVEINYGVHDRLKNNQPFINDAKKPSGATFYPFDLTKEDFEKWLKGHPQDRDTFISPYTLIRKKGKKLVAVKYSDEYKNDLKSGANYLKEAASLSKNESLKKFLNSRADAFLSNDYYQSEIDWVDVKDSNIEVTIGPYEVYEDDLFNYKASFEAFITIVDAEESKKLQMVAEHLNELESNLPVPDQMKNFSRGASSPIFVVNLVYSAGDAKKGVQTVAFNLPNDEKVRESKGSKKVLMKNIMEAKFNKILKPLTEKFLDDAVYNDVSFRTAFNEILMHEVSHALGPGFINVEGGKITLNQALKETYSTLEEAKADVMGIYNTMYLLEKGFLSAEIHRELLPTYLAGIFRAVRFGVEEAHGKANIIEFNYIVREGGFTFDQNTKKWKLDAERTKAGIRKLLNEILMIQGTGDYLKAVSFIRQYGEMPEEIKTSLENLKDVPVDIFPIFKFAESIK